MGAITDMIDVNVYGVCSWVQLSNVFTEWLCQKSQLDSIWYKNSIGSREVSISTLPSEYQYYALQILSSMRNFLLCLESFKNRPHT